MEIKECADMNVFLSAWKSFFVFFGGGQGWIRTTEGVSQQIYSLPHLATLVLARHLQDEKESGRRDSNPRPSAWKANALSTELLPHCSLAVGKDGFEPPKA